MTLRRKRTSRSLIEKPRARGHADAECTETRQTRLILKKLGRRHCQRPGELDNDPGIGWRAFVTGAGKKLFRRGQRQGYARPGSGLARRANQIRSAPRLAATIQQNPDDLLNEWRAGD